MDVDIDLQTTFDPLRYFPTAVRASMVKDGMLTKHPAGAYFQSIPTDKATGVAAIPYGTAEDLGYTKVDFLHLSILDHFGSKQEIRDLLKVEPDWTLLLDETVVSKLFQLHKHFDVVYKIKPKSVQEVADCIALIRPGKRALIPAYVKNKDAIRHHLYKPAADGKYHFKRAHSVAYSLTIVLQLHLIKGGIL